MSTRANVVVKDRYGKIWFYRHSDGYPEGTMPTLQKFIQLVRTGKIRNNASQSAGWLILIGAEEYGTYYTVEQGDVKKDTLTAPSPCEVSGWKCGAYEPTTGLHSDIEYLYEIDLEAKTISCFNSWSADGHGKHLVCEDTPQAEWAA